MDKRNIFIWTRNPFQFSFHDSLRVGNHQHLLANTRNKPLCLPGETLTPSPYEVMGVLSKTQFPIINKKGVGKQRVVLMKRGLTKGSSEENNSEIFIFSTEIWLKVGLKGKFAATETKPNDRSVSPLPCKPPANKYYFLAMELCVNNDNLVVRIESCVKS